MINQNQFVYFPYFYPYFDLQSYLWCQSIQNNSSIPKNYHLKDHDQSSKNAFSIKAEENHQADTQKAQHPSCSAQQMMKRESSFHSQKNIQCKQQVKNQQSSAQGVVSQRNETKNISKNFGKAILSFAKTNTKFSKKLLKKYDVEKQSLINYIKKARKNLNSLQDLRQMWGADNQNDNLKKCLRIISHHFMRKHCLEYIFNSRIKSVSAHTKYRHRLMEGMSRPSQFTNIKVN